MKQWGPFFFPIKQNFSALVGLYLTLIIENLASKLRCAVRVDYTADF